MQAEIFNKNYTAKILKQNVLSPIELTPVCELKGSVIFELYISNPLLF